MQHTQPLTVPPYLVPAPASAIIPASTPATTSSTKATYINTSASGLDCCLHHCSCLLSLQSLETAGT